MLAENPHALRFILSDDVYLLPKDKLGLADVAAAVAVSPREITADAQPQEEVIVPSVVSEPVIELTKQASPSVEELKIPKLITPEPNTPAAEQVAQPTTRAEFVALGDNQKNILVLVNYPEVEFMADAHLKALENAFTRLGHTRADFAIFNIAHHPQATFEKLSAHFKPQVLLILGADSYPQGLPQQPFNQLREGKGGRKLLFTYSFKEMMGDKEKTRAYWEQMKSL